VAWLDGDVLHLVAAAPVGSDEIIRFEVRDPSGALDEGDVSIRYDADGDGLTNDLEQSIGTDASLLDTDGNGLPDGDELALGLDPLDPDPDGDGLPDGAEVALGSDPRDRGRRRRASCRPRPQPTPRRR
jgi:hypothetical protein